LANPPEQIYHLGEVEYGPERTQEGSEDEDEDEEQEEAEEEEDEDSDDTDDGDAKWGKGMGRIKL